MVRVLDWTAIPGLGLLVLAVASWTREGLFVTAPYFFGIPALFLVVVLGAVMLWIVRSPAGSDSRPSA